MHKITGEREMRQKEKHNRIRHSSTFDWHNSERNHCKVVELRMVLYDDERSIRHRDRD